MKFKIGDRVCDWSEGDVHPYANQDWSPGPLGFTSIFP